jgi:hypothetical protein
MRLDLVGINAVRHADFKTGFLRPTIGISF